MSTGVSSAERPAELARAARIARLLPTGAISGGTSERPTDALRPESSARSTVRKELRERQGLLDEIERAEPRRFDRGLDGAVARHHHDRARSPVRLRPFAQQCDAIGVRHPDVQQHEIRVVLSGSRAPRLRPRRRPLHSLRPRGSPSGVRGSRIHHRRPVCALHSCVPPRSGTPFAGRTAATRCGKRQLDTHPRTTGARVVRLDSCHHVLRQSFSRSPAPGRCPFGFVVT